MDFKDIYILYGIDRRTGNPILTSWMDDEDTEYVDGVITGISEYEIPFWGSEPPKRAVIHSIPEEVDKKEFAKQLNGILVTGWKK